MSGPASSPSRSVSAGSGERCAVCAGARLELSLAVAGEAGAEGLVPSTDRYGTALADIHRCRACGHRQLCPMPAHASLAEAYEDATDAEYLEEERGQRQTAAVMLEEIEREIDPGRLADLGCWVGFLPAVAHERGWEPTGVEPSAWAAAHARARPGVEVVESDLASAQLPAGSFDAVVMADVLEHLPAPGEALERAHELLVPGGVLALALPDAGSRVARVLGARWWSVIPTHVHYFDRDGICRLLASAGYEPLRIGTAPKTFSAAYYLGRLAGYSPVPARGLVALARALSLSERLLTPDFGDRMLVLARRGA